MREKIMDRLAEAVKEAVGIGCVVHFLKSEKNNGLIFQSVVIKEPGTNAAPLIYIDSIMERIEVREISLKDAAKEIASTYKNVKYSYNQKIHDVISNISREYVLENVVYQLVNAEKNMRFLADMPHKDFLDMVAVYRVVVDSTESENVSFKVKKSLCDTLSITEEELDAAASQNTEKAGFCVKSIASIMTEITGIPMPEEYDTDIPMFVITNPKRFNGAAAMLYNSCFSDLAEKFGDDLYILPSSIHEVLVIPAGNREPDDLRDMVCLINASEVAGDEVLSNNVYRYSSKDRILSIV